MTNHSKLNASLFCSKQLAVSNFETLVRSKGTVTKKTDNWM